MFLLEAKSVSTATFTTDCSLISTIHKSLKSDLYFDVLLQPYKPQKCYLRSTDFGKWLSNPVHN